MSHIKYSKYSSEHSNTKSGFIMSKSGFITFDTLISIVAIVVMVSEILYVSNTLVSNLNTYYKTQHALNRLMLASDYIVKHSCYKTGTTLDDICMPNIYTGIDKDTLEEIKKRFGFKVLYVGLTPPDSLAYKDTNCIYRIVLKDNTPTKLYVCYANSI